GILLISKSLLLIYLIIIPPRLIYNPIPTASLKTNTILRKVYLIIEQMFRFSIINVSSILSGRNTDREKVEFMDTIFLYSVGPIIVGCIVQLFKRWLELQRKD